MKRRFFPGAPLPGRTVTTVTTVTAMTAMTAMTADGGGEVRP